MLERRDCTAQAPMPMADRNRFYWIHADAADVGAFLNMRLYTCPSCGFTFHAPPRTPDQGPQS